MKADFFEKIHIDILNMGIRTFCDENIQKYYKTKTGFWPPIKIMDIGTGVRRIWRLDR